MTVINTNTSSLVARDAIQRNDRAMSSAMERLSTGSRINSAKDDAAGLAIAERMSSTVGGLNMAVRNANDGISLLQTVEGATKEISAMLSRMRELSVQAASGTYTATDRAALDLEFGALMDEMDRIAKNTEWNGEKVLIGATNNNYDANDPVLTKGIQIGTDASQTMTVTLRSWVPTVAYDSDATTAAGDNGNGIDQNDLSAYSNSGSSAEDDTNTSALFWNNSSTVTRIDITSVADATRAIKVLDNAINGAGSERARIGSFMARLQHAADNLQNVATNTSASLSQISDADYATETTELARTQIISQASTAMLAQANQVKQTVLSLLQ
jgi:flagellin